MSEESLGAYLKKEREKKDISLDKIAKSTRISLSNLKAIENDEFDRIPAKIFLKGYITNYAAFIGLDADEVLDRFHKEIQINNKSLSLHGEYSEVLIQKRSYLKLSLVWILIFILLAALGLGFWYNLIPFLHF